MQLKLLVDENISPLTVKFLREKGSTVNLFLEGCFDKLEKEHINPYGKLIVISEGKIRIRE